MGSLLDNGLRSMGSRIMIAENQAAETRLVVAPSCRTCLHIVCLLCFPVSVHGFTGNCVGLPRRHPSMTRMTEDRPWWSDQEKTPFKCTVCGQCCKWPAGEVWFNSNEFAELVMHKGLPAEQVLDDYADEVLNGWVKAKTKEIEEVQGCVFLADDGRSCSIYGQRPVQCRTYPWWPKTLENEDAWLRERSNCEGINNADVPLGQRSDGGLATPTGQTDAAVIYRNRALYTAWLDGFVHLPALVKDGRRHLLKRVHTVEPVVTLARAWVTKFVFKYGLCPQLGPVLPTIEGRVGGPRYRVHLCGDDKHLLADRLRFEILDLLCTSEHDVSSTLLMLPLSELSFEEFNALSEQLESEFLPEIERELLGPAVNRASVQGSQGRVSKRRLSRLRGKQIERSHVRLAFCHQHFRWDNMDFNHPLSFERRAPFPTIAILRPQPTHGQRGEPLFADHDGALQAAGSKQLVDEFDELCVERMFPSSSSRVPIFV